MNPQVVRNSLGTGSLQNIVLAVAAAAAEGGHTHFRSYSHWPRLAVIAVARGADKNTLWKTKQAEAEVNHGHSCNRHSLLRYSTRCPVVGQGLDFLTSSLEVGREEDQLRRSNLYSRCSSVVVDSVVVGRNIRYTGAVVGAHTSGWNNRISKGVGDDWGEEGAAAEAEDNVEGVVSDVACVEAAAAVVDEEGEDIEHVEEGDAEHTEDVVVDAANVGAGAENADMGHNPLASAVGVGLPS